MSSNVPLDKLLTSMLDYEVNTSASYRTSNKAVIITCKPHNTKKNATFQLTFKNGELINAPIMLMFQPNAIQDINEAYKQSVPELFGSIIVKNQKVIDEMRVVMERELGGISSSQTLSTQNTSTFNASSVMEKSKSTKKPVFDM